MRWTKTKQAWSSGFCCTLSFATILDALGVQHNKDWASIMVLVIIASASTIRLLTWAHHTSTGTRGE